MKTFTSSLFALAAALSLASAAPAAVAPQVAERGAPYVAVTLYGAAGASYTTNVYYGEEPTFTYNALSISKVSYDYNLAYCSFYGIDEEIAPPVVANGGQVGPPQTIVSIYCECLE